MKRPVRLEGHKEPVTLTRGWLVALILLPMIILGVTFLVAFNKAGDATATANQAAMQASAAAAQANEQADRNSRLAQQLCKQFSNGRISGNQQVRQPLREALRAIAVIFHQVVAQEKANPSTTTAAQKREAVQLANKFDDLTRRVIVAKPVACEFTK